MTSADPNLTQLEALEELDLSGNKLESLPSHLAADSGLLQVFMPSWNIAQRLNDATSYHSQYLQISNLRTNDYSETWILRPDLFKSPKGGHLAKSSVLGLGRQPLRGITFASAVEAIGATQPCPWAKSRAGDCWLLGAAHRSLLIEQIVTSLVGCFWTRHIEKEPIGKPVLPGYLNPAAPAAPAAPPPDRARARVSHFDDEDDVAPPPPPPEDRLTNRSINLEVRRGKEFDEQRYL